MVTLSPDIIVWIKKKYATTEELQNADKFKAMSTPLQQQILASYQSLPDWAEAPAIATDMAQWAAWQANRAAELEAKRKTEIPPPLTANKTDTLPEPDVSWITLNTAKEKITWKADYLDKEAQRLNEIQANLVKYSMQNPELFRDKAQFQTFFNYNSRVPEQKKILDSFFDVQQVKFWEEKLQKDRLTAISNMSDAELMSLADTWDLNLINLDPELQARYALAKKNKDMLDFVYGTWDTTSHMPKIDGLDGLPDNIQQEITQASVDYAASQKGLQALQTQMQNTYDDLTKKAEWTGETDQYLRVKANKINASLQKEYNLKAIASADMLAKYNALWAEAERTAKELSDQTDDALKKMQLYSAMYGTYEQRNVPAEDMGAAKTIDVWTAKNPKIMQWNPKTQRYDIYVGWVAWGWGGWGWGGWGWENWALLGWISSFFNQDFVWDYQKYLQWWAPAKWVQTAVWWPTAFRQQANAYFNLIMKNSFKGVEVVDSEALRSKLISKAWNIDTLKTDIWEVLTQVWQLEAIVNYINKNWRPSKTLWGSSITQNLEGKISRAQLTSKWESQFNLWVLNWPDLEIISSVIPTPSIKNSLWSKKTAMQRFVDAGNEFIRDFNIKNAWSWIKISKELSVPWLVEKESDAKKALQNKINANKKRLWFSLVQWTTTLSQQMKLLWIGWF